MSSTVSVNELMGGRVLAFSFSDSQLAAYDAILKGEYQSSAVAEMAAQCCVCHSLY